MFKPMFLTIRFQSQRIVQYWNISYSKCKFCNEYCSHFHERYCSEYLNVAKIYHYFFYYYYFFNSNPLISHFFADSILSYTFTEHKWFDMILGKIHLLNSYRKKSIKYSTDYFMLWVLLQIFFQRKVFCKIYIERILEARPPDWLQLVGYKT